MRPTANELNDTPASTGKINPPNGCRTYESLFKQYNWDVRTMLAIAEAESNCNPNAISPPNWDGVRDYGLCQLHGQYILDPSKNVAVAYNKWLRQGYHAWTSFNTNKYRKYL